MLRKKPIHFLACVAALALIAPTGLPQDQPDYKELPNFHRVNDTLFRGAQPRVGGLQLLKQLGVKTIINLRDNDSRAQGEAAEAHSLGLQYVNIATGRLGRPDDKDIERALSIITSASNQPVFVHCKHGADRTGVVIAVYRIAHDGWTSKQAKAEANKYGMKPWQFAMKDYIHDFYRRHEQRNPSTQKSPSLLLPQPPDPLNRNPC